MEVQGQGQIQEQEQVKLQVQLVQLVLLQVEVIIVIIIIVMAEVVKVLVALVLWVGIELCDRSSYPMTTQVIGSMTLTLSAAVNPSPKSVIITNLLKTSTGTGTSANAGANTAMKKSLSRSFEDEPFDCAFVSSSSPSSKPISFSASMTTPTSMQPSRIDFTSRSSGTSVSGIDGSNGNGNDNGNGSRHGSSNGYSYANIVSKNQSIPMQSPRQMALPRSHSYTPAKSMQQSQYRSRTRAMTPASTSTSTPTSSAPTSSAPIPAVSPSKSQRASSFRLRRMQLAQQRKWKEEYIERAVQSKTMLAKDVYTDDEDENEEDGNDHGNDDNDNDSIYGSSYRSRKSNSNSKSRHLRRKRNGARSGAKGLNDRIISSAQDGNIFVWEGRSCIWALETPNAKSQISAMSVSTSGYLIVGTVGGSVVLYDEELELAGNYRISSYVVGLHRIDSLCLGEQNILVGTVSSKLMEISISDGALMNEITRSHSGKNSCGLATNPLDNNEVATVGGDGILRVINAEKRCELEIANLECSASFVCYSNNGEYLVVGLDEPNAGAFLVLNSADLLVKLKGRP